jgi:hypothetical protein
MDPGLGPMLIYRTTAITWARGVLITVRKLESKAGKNMTIYFQRGMRKILHQGTSKGNSVPSHTSAKVNANFLIALTKNCVQRKSNSGLLR